ncbi:hypothetical protein FACS189492_3080 [Clostridia bacterium]|nr:hypothetical protein FACS189492_3080 [Clostridia bacterium]
MPHRDFVYTGEPIPQIDKTRHREFLLNVQSAMLASLAERGLLTKEQAKRVMENIERKSHGK